MHGIPDGEICLLARPRDPDDLAEKIVRLLFDEKLRESVISKALHLVKKHYSWATIAEKFKQVYAEVLRRGLS